jgi:hypothetical protein
MAARRALNRYRVFLGWLSLVVSAVLAAMALLVIVSPRADAAPISAAATGGPCSYPLPAGVSVHSTLQVVVNGVDSPSMTSTTDIDVPENWPGTGGLFADGAEQGRSLACFMPIDQYDYQVEPPAIGVVAATSTRPALTHITNTVTVTDASESGWLCGTQWQCWHAGLWDIQKNGAGYAVTFSPAPAAKLPGSVSWTVKLTAQALNVLKPLPRPETDDGQGTLTWLFPPNQHQRPSVTASITSPWPVRVNLASDRWWPRWLSDSSWTTGDGLVLDAIVILVVSLFRRQWREDLERRRIADALTFIAVLSVLCYAWYVGDDYLWHNDKIFGFRPDFNAIWELENTLLVAISALYFVFALKVSRAWLRLNLLHWVPFAGITSVAAAVAVSAPPADLGVWGLWVEMVPLLWTITLSSAGTLLLIRHLWPFKREGRPGRPGARNGASVRRIDWVTGLVLGTPVASILILGQSALSSYYYWLHSDWWRQSDGGAFRWVASDLLNDSHWWIGDGIQWSFYFALFVGVFALLRAMGRDARGVFLAPCGGGESDERGVFWVMAALAGCLYIGTWGYYAGFAVPLPFIVTLAGLRGWGLTRRLSDLDCGSRVVGGPDSESPPAAGAVSAAARVSNLVKYRKDLLAAAKAASTDPAANPRLGTTPPAGSPPKPMLSTQLTEIPLDTSPPGLLKLKPRANPGAVALALGPEGTWWANGIATVKSGAYLAIGPIGFDIFIAWNDGSLSLRNFPFGLQDTVGYGVSVAISWLTGLFLFGVLVPYLRGTRTPLKGVAFGLIALLAYGADAALRHGLGVAPYPTWIVDGLMAVALFATTGLFLDFRTLQNYEEQPLLGTIYRLGSVRVAVTSVTAVIVVGVSLWQAVYLTDQTTQQRAQNVSNAAQYTGTSFGNK